MDLTFVTTGRIKLSSEEEKWYHPQIIYHDEPYGEFVFSYHVNDEYHHHYKPARYHLGGEEDWWIKGEQLSDDEVSTIKTILSDVSIAPLYINHPTFKYTARHILSRRTNNI